MWFLAFRVGNDPPSRLRIRGLHGSARVTWHEGGDASVSLDDGRDRARVTGAVQVVSRPWPLFLLRQAALGRLSEWYGRDALQFDHHVHRLGIPDQARKAFSGLDPDVRELLSEYAEGVNSALRSRRVQLTPAVAAFDLDLEPWAPWHSVAVEHLIAWLAATPELGPYDSEPAVQGFFSSREALGRLLGLGGLDHGAAWTMEGQPPGIFVRIVYGTTGVPPLSVMTLATPLDTTETVTWLGMPTAWAGRDGNRSWVVLPSGRVVVDSGAVATSPVYVPILLRDGSRDVAVRIGDGNRIAIAGGWRITWPGLAPVSDLGAVSDLAAGRPANFRLVDGIAMATRHGASGPPRTFGGQTVEAGSVVLVSSAPEKEELAQGLALETDIGFPAVFLATRTAWAYAAAQATATRLRADAATTAIEPDALQYLSGWDGGFDGASIGAVIFDAITESGDSTANFLAAMNRLSLRYGTMEESWRWERDGGMLRYPGWLETSPYPDALLLPDRYAPVEMERSGHPTAPSWGSASPWVNPAAPAAWEAFIEDRAGGRVYYRRPFVPYDKLLGRFSTTPREPGIRALPGRPTTGDRTALVPDS